MIVISYGVEKSGSTLAFEMTKAVLELNGHVQLRLADGPVDPGPTINEVGPWTDERLARLVECTEGMKIVVRTHNPPYHLSTDRVLEHLGSGDLKIHVVYRDPRDTVVSMLDDAVRARASNERRHSDLFTVEDAIAKLAKRLRALRCWGWLPSLKLVYDDFAFDRVSGPQLIADDLGMTVDPDEVWRIVNSRWTRRNTARPERYRTDLWPDEVARVERAFPLFLELVRGNPCVGWFVEWDQALDHDC
jgi:hypothetical protein